MKLLAPLAFVPLAAGLLSGQTLSNPNPKLGFQPSGVYSLSQIESINNVNGNLILNIPLGALGPDRVGATHGIGLAYNSAIWEPQAFSTATDGEGVPGLIQGISSVTQDPIPGGWNYHVGYQLENDLRPCPT